jgi:hypothetical protein
MDVESVFMGPGLFLISLIDPSASPSCESIDERDLSTICQLEKFFVKRKKDKKIKNFNDMQTKKTNHLLNVKWFN